MTARTSAQNLPPRTLPALLDDRVARYGNREFLRFEGRSWGFVDLRADAQRVGAALQANGVGRDDRVALMLGNHPEFIACWFGLALIGAIEVPINTAHRGEMLSYLLRQSGSRVLLVDAEFLPQLATARDALNDLARLVVIGARTSDALPPGSMTWERFLAAAGNLNAERVRPDDSAAIMFTSGTTGPSKGAIMPHEYLVNAGQVIVRAGEYSERDCLYNALPLFHGNAQFLSTMPALIAGARMVLARRFSASRFWDEIVSNDCTEFNYIGGIVPILLKARPTTGDQQHSLRVMVGAGAPRDVAIAFEERFNVALVEGYGMTEIGVPITNQLRARRPGSCGRRNPDYDIRLVNDDGDDIDDDSPGELLVRPRIPGAMMREYCGMPQETVAAWRDLWFHTGDYLRRDSDEFFYFVDRKKDALRRRGENISSYEVEREVNRHPAVLESAAVAVRSTLGEDEVMIVVALRPGATLTAQEIWQHCTDSMAPFMVPRYVRFVQALPRTPTERVRKVELRAEGVTADTLDRQLGT